jgi:CRP-like cAMP-binding protein
MVNRSSAFVPEATEWRDILEELYHGRNVAHFKSGQRIPMPSAEVLIVCRGVAQLATLYPNGEEVILGLICPSMPFGMPLSQLDPLEATALTDLVLMRVHWAEVEQSPRLAQSLLREMTRRLQQTELMLAIAGYRRVDDRLRQLLSLLRQEVGQVTTEGVRLAVRLTHQQLACLIGTTRVTVTRLLSEFRAEGWLNIDDTRHLVLQQDKPSKVI